MNTLTQSIIVRHKSDRHVGIETVNLSRNTIGFVEQGLKLIHRNDSHITIIPGTIFHLNSGIYHIENSPSADKPFCEILFYYSPEQVNGLMTPPELLQRKRLQYCNMPLSDDHCTTYEAWPMLTQFFDSATAYIESGIHVTNPNLGHIKLSELMYLILSHPSCSLAQSICESVSGRSSKIREVVKTNMLSNISLVEMAKMCDLSLSRFNQQFQETFGSTPHRWIIKQRLEFAALHLISTNISINTLSKMCNFSNPSLFIKHFKSHYNITPLNYRLMYKTDSAPKAESNNGPRG